MPTFRVAGRGRDTGRKRQQQYVAADEAHAKELAEAEGTSVESIERLPDAPPTERQLAYAKDLGISVPVDASIEDVSDLIDARLHWDKPAAARHQAIAQRYRVIFTQYTGKKALFDRLMAKLIEPGREQDDGKKVRKKGSGLGSGKKGQVLDLEFCSHYMVVVLHGSAFADRV